MGEGRIISGDRELSIAALMENAKRAASGLDGLGIGEGDTVAIILRNDFAFFEAAFAASLLGAYAVPINWHLKADEAGYILGDCDARVLVTHADLLPALEAAVPDGCAVLVAPTPPEICAVYDIDPGHAALRPGWTDWNDWLASHPAWRQPPRADRPSMLYTSGTTGMPKGVRREPWPSDSAARRDWMFETCFGFSASSHDPVRTIINGPMYHVVPHHYGLMAAQCGALVVLQPRFDAEQLLALIARHRITHVHLVPTMFVRLLRLPEAVRAGHDTASLEFVSHGAAPCPPDVKRRMIEWWGPVINEYYGATESGAVTFNTSEEALGKPGTVGRVMDGAEVRIYDQAGNPLPSGEIGEIYCRLAGWPDFTYHKDDNKRREIERDGLITIGDMGYLDDDGYLFLCDRAHDMVISGGVNIYPAEIEAVLIDMPGVRDCAVFGIPDEEYGESVCAYVERLDGSPLDAESVRAYLKSRIANYKVPRVVEFQAELPREDSGKIFKRRLREPYWRDAGRNI